MGNFIIIRFNSKLLILSKFVEFLRISAIKAGLNNYLKKRKELIPFFQKSRF